MIQRLPASLAEFTPGSIRFQSLMSAEAAQQAQPDEQDAVTTIMIGPERVRDDDAAPTTVRPLSSQAPRPGKWAFWMPRLQLVATAACSMFAAAALSCSVAAFALEQFAEQEIALGTLEVIAATLIVICAIAGGLLGAVLLQRLAG